MSDNNTTIELTGKVTGRIEICPNGKDTVFVDGNSGSLGGHDDDPRVHFLTVQGSDYVYSGNWQRVNGSWVPFGNMSGLDQVRRRGSGPYDRAPKTRATAVLNTIANTLVTWYDNNDGQAKMNAAELRDARIRNDQAQEALRAAEAALAAAQEAAREADRRLTRAQLATVTVRVVPS